MFCKHMMEIACGFADNHLAASTSTKQASSFPPAAECLQHLQSAEHHYAKSKQQRRVLDFLSFPSNCLLAGTCGEHAHKARVKFRFSEV